MISLISLLTSTYLSYSSFPSSSSCSQSLQLSKSTAIQLGCKKKEKQNNLHFIYQSKVERGGKSAPCFIFIQLLGVNCIDCHLTNISGVKYMFLIQDWNICTSLHICLFFHLFFIFYLCFLICYHLLFFFYISLSSLFCYPPK